MYIVAGLGNPGDKYEKTRHNMGFRAIDRFADEHGIRFSGEKFNAKIGEGFINGEKVILLKPMTYMNLSGNAVAKAFYYYKIPDDKLIVIYDDIDLPLGALRIRKSGGAGTHNGMKSVITELGFKDFPRVRIGIGGSGDRNLIDYVIGRVSGDELEMLDGMAGLAAAAVTDIIVKGIDNAMNIHNVKRKPDDENDQLHGDQRE